MDIRIYGSLPAKDGPSVFGRLFVRVIVAAALLVAIASPAGWSPFSLQPADAATSRAAAPGLYADAGLIRAETPSATSSPTSRFKGTATDGMWSAQPAESRVGDEALPPPTRIVVKLRTGAESEVADMLAHVVADEDHARDRSPDFSADLASAQGLRPLKGIPELGLLVLDVRPPVIDPAGNILEPPLGPDAAVLAAALRALPNDPQVEWAEYDIVLQGARVPNDPYYSPQWGPPEVGLPDAWDLTTGSASVTIAIIDSGLYAIPSEFGGRIVSPYSTMYGTTAPWAWLDVYGHGTAVASIAAAMGNNGVGIAGTAWNVSIMPVHITDTGTSYASDYAAAVSWAVSEGAHVINYSAGSHSSSYTMRNAVNYALSMGVSIVASAGNDGYGSGVQYPAAYPGVIAVGATNSYGSRASFSSTGSTLDIVAPGQSVLGWTTNGSSAWTEYLNGTSFSAPMVAGVAALMLSRNSALTPTRVSQILTLTATDRGAEGWDSEYGDGLLNAEAAVAAAGDQQAPLVSFATPLSGATVSGNVPVRVEASDDLGLVRLELLLNGQVDLTYVKKSPRSWDTSSSGEKVIHPMSGPFQSYLNTEGLADGSTQTLTARAYDAAGNVRETSITVTVDNRPPTTTTTAPATTTTTSPPPSTTTTTTPPAAAFTDVPQGHTYALQINDMATRRVVDGYGGGLFGPEDWVKRQQFAKMVILAMGYPVSEADVSAFGDVDRPMDNLYPDNYVAVAAAHGITLGVAPGRFAPWNNMTRAQLITMVARAAGVGDPPTEYSPPFGNFSTTHFPWARRAAFAGLLGGLQGMGAGYDFWAPATRGEVCVMLYNLLHR